MKLTFLGTGTSQGVPIIGCTCPTCRSEDPKDKRLRTSAFIEYKDQKILIDCGPDFRQQMLQNKFDHLDAILITHEHNDHVIGLDDVRPLNFMQKIDMPIFTLQRTLEELKLRFSYAFETRPYPGAPRFQLFPIEAFQSFRINGIDILPLEIMHGKLPILAYKIGSLCYVTDAKSISQASEKIIKGCEVLVLNALRYHEHNTHFSLNDALEFAERVGAKKTYLTHLSHLFTPHETLKKELPVNVEIAYDGLQVTL